MKEQYNDLEESFDSLEEQFAAIEEEFEKEEEQSRIRWERRKEAIQQKKKSRALHLRAIKIGIGAAAVLAVLLAFSIWKKGNADKLAPAGEQESMQKMEEENRLDRFWDIEGQGERRTAGNLEAQSRSYQYLASEDTVRLKKGIASGHAILVDLGSRKILAGRGEKKQIVPASMTKVLTLLVAVENMEDWEGTFKITGEITDYCYINECSVAGFAKEEKVSVMDLLYGTILPSGADAALGLANYVAGSQEAFVRLMNEKLEALGLSETTHFTNCVGLYDEEHYCTPYDMAVIMEAAMENEICREILSSRTYTTSKTKQHPEGMILSNWFLRRIEDKDAGGQVIGAKTGYVAQSGNCAVSYGADSQGREYICVTAGASGSWECIYDHVDIYKRFLEEGLNSQ